MNADVHNIANEHTHKNVNLWIVCQKNDIQYNGDKNETENNNKITFKNYINWSSHIFLHLCLVQNHFVQSIVNHLNPSFPAFIFPKVVIKIKTNTWHVASWKRISLSVFLKVRLLMICFQSIFDKIEVVFQCQILSSNQKHLFLNVV